MKIKTTLVAGILLLVPAVATAECFGEKHTTAMSCAEGTTMDMETNSCVPVTGQARTRPFEDEGPSILSVAFLRRLSPPPRGPR